MIVSETCRTTHQQNCDHCDDLTCGDNTSHKATLLFKLQSYATLEKSKLKEIGDTIGSQFDKGYALGAAHAYEKLIQEIKGE